MKTHFMVSNIDGANEFASLEEASEHAKKLSLNDLLDGADDDYDCLGVYQLVGYIRVVAPAPKSYFVALK